MVSLTGCVLMLDIGLIQKKEHILAVQCIQFGIQTATILFWALSPA